MASLLVMSVSSGCGVQLQLSASVCVCMCTRNGEHVRILRDFVTMCGDRCHCCVRSVRGTVRRAVCEGETY